MPTKKKYPTEKYRGKRLQLNLNDQEWMQIEKLATSKKMSKTNFVRYVLDILYKQLKP